jgi:serine/threonine-protein kinase
MGDVYRAADTTLARYAALKVLPPAFAADADLLARFQAEARALAAFDHPGIVTVYSVEQATAPSGRRSSWRSSRASRPASSSFGPPVQ